MVFLLIWSLSVVLLYSICEKGFLDVMKLQEWPCMIMCHIICLVIKNGISFTGAVEQISPTHIVQVT